jgi:mRNA-degrading endonuclease RelE of RelBE toxin-antitoxin system
MSYAVELEERAKKALKSFDKNAVRLIRDKIDQLAHNPLDPRISKPVKMFPGRRAARVGDWRIIYHIVEARLTLIIAAICPRDRAYEETAKRGKK